MKSRMFLTVASAALMALGVSQAASAQLRYDFKIPNAFVANGKTLAAGSYIFAVDLADNTVTVTPADLKGGSVPLLIETRTAERKPLTEPELVFDRLDGQLYVSELQVPGDDGYVLFVNKAKHTHESLRGTRAKK
jgi:hypothetical protein